MCTSRCRWTEPRSIRPGGSRLNRQGRRARNLKLRSPQIHGGDSMVNKVILIGNLTADPEVKATPKGTYVANMRLATNTYSGKDEAGNAKEQTEFHSLGAFGELSEFAGQYLHKGRAVFAEGRLHTSSWEDTAGQKRKRTEIWLDELKFVGIKPQESAA